MVYTIISISKMDENIDKPVKCAYCKKAPVKIVSDIPMCEDCYEAADSVFIFKDCKEGV